MKMAGRKTSAAYQMYGFIPKVTNGKHVALCTYCNRELQNTAAVRMQKHRNSCFATRVENTETACLATGTVASMHSNSDSKQSLSTDIGFSVYQRLHNNTLNAANPMTVGSGEGEADGALKREQGGDYESTPPPPIVSLGVNTGLYEENLKTRQQGNLSDNLGVAYNHRIPNNSLNNNNVNNNNNNNSNNMNIHTSNMRQINDMDYETTVTASSPRNYPDDEIKLEPSALNGHDPTFAASKITANAFQEISKVAAAATASQQHSTELLGSENHEGLSALSSACRAVESYDQHHQNQQPHQQQVQYSQFSIEEFDDMANDIRIGPNALTHDDPPQQSEKNPINDGEEIIRMLSDNGRKDCGSGLGSFEADDENDEDDDDDELEHLENHLDVIQELMPRSRKMQRLQTTMTAVATEYYRNKTAYYAHLNENSQLKRVLMLLQSRKLQLEIEKHTRSS